MMECAVDVNSLREENCHCINLTSIFSKNITIFYVNTMQVSKIQFYWSSWMGWPGINQSAAIFLPPCALAYDVMPFCVDGNMTTSEVVHHLLINFPLFLTRDGRSMSATRCQHLTAQGRHACDVNSYLRLLLEAQFFKSSHSIML